MPGVPFGTAPAARASALIGLNLNGDVSGRRSEFGERRPPGLTTRMSPILFAIAESSRSCMTPLHIAMPTACGNRRKIGLVTATQAKSSQVE
jgi:hypothetical protein